MDLNDPTTVALLAAEAFEAAGHRYALYGGLLTAAYGDLRETRDADLAVIDLTADVALQALASKDLRVLIAFENATLARRCDGTSLCWIPQCSTPNALRSPTSSLM